MLGGGFFHTQNGGRDKTFYFMAQLKQGTDAFKELEKNKLALLNGVDNYHTLHSTLLTLTLNLDAPMITIISSDKKKLHPNITTNIDKFYNETFRKDKPELLQVPTLHYIMGEWISKPFVTKISKDRVITDFRMKIYTEITNLFAAKGYTISIDKITYPQHIVAYANKNGAKTAIYAVPKYDFGIGQWEPHISYGKISDIRNHNPALYKQYETLVEDPNTPATYGYRPIQATSSIIVKGKQYQLYKDSGSVLFSLTGRNEPEYKVNMDTDISGVVIG